MHRRHVDSVKTHNIVYDDLTIDATISNWSESVEKDKGGYYKDKFYVVLISFSEHIDEIKQMCKNVIFYKRIFLGISLYNYE